MRSILFRVLMLVLMIGSSQLLFAQPTERVKRRAENRANQRVDQKVDEAVDKAFDSLGNLFKNKQRPPLDSANTAAADAQPAETATRFEGLFGAGNAEPWEPIRNDAPISYTMEIEQQKGNKTDKTVLDISFDTWLTGYRIRDDKQATRFILDNEKGTMTTVVEEEGKQPQAFRMNQFRLKVDEATVEDAMEKTTIEKTGRTRTIDGYACQEYTFKNEEGSGQMWITEELKADFSALMQAFVRQNRGKRSEYFDPSLPYRGFPIEQTFTDHKGKETTITRFRQIRTGNNIDRSVLNLEGIEVATIGG